MRSAPTTDWLRERFANPRPFEPLSQSDRTDLPEPARQRPSAVLVPIVARRDSLALLLTLRTAHLSDHAGQISFPGGRVHPEDESLTHTALREAEEEIGLHRSKVEVLGEMNAYATGTGYRITPIIGLVAEPFAPRLQASEVAELFEVPLAVVLDPVNHQRNTLIVQGTSRKYHAIPFRRYYIWGATAALLFNLHRFLLA